MSNYTAYNADINIINSELTVDKNRNLTSFDALCECNGNQLVLTYVADSGNTPEDWCFAVLDNMYNKALQYLSDALTNEENVFVNAFRYKDSPTAYDIYYGCEDQFETPADAARWVLAHGGIENIGHYYTETRDGEKTAIEF